MSQPEERPIPVEAESGRTGKMRCPHCLAPGTIRTSREVTPTFREQFYSCSNVACGHTWKTSQTYEYGLSPSAIPNPEVDLPMRPFDREEVMAALRPPPGPDPNQPTFFD